MEMFGKEEIESRYDNERGVKALAADAPLTLRDASTTVVYSLTLEEK